jgi:hypothetical protein
MQYPFSGTGDCEKPDVSSLLRRLNEACKDSPRQRRVAYDAHFQREQFVWRKLQANFEELDFDPGNRFSL